MMMVQGANQFHNGADFTCRRVKRQPPYAANLEQTQRKKQIFRTLSDFLNPKTFLSGRLRLDA